MQSDFRFCICEVAARESNKKVVLISIQVTMPFIKLTQIPLKVYVQIKMSLTRIDASFVWSCRECKMAC